MDGGADPRTVGAGAGLGAVLPARGLARARFPVCVAGARAADHSLWRVLLPDPGNRVDSAAPTTQPAGPKARCKSKTGPRAGCASAGRHGLIKNASRRLDAEASWWRWPRRLHAPSWFRPHRVRRRLPAARHRPQPVRCDVVSGLVFSAVMVALLTTRLGQWLTPPLLWRRFLLSTRAYAIAGMDKDGLSARVMFHARNERRLDLRVSPALSDTPEKAQAWADIARRSRRSLRKRPRRCRLHGCKGGGR